jgi:hypothetical protein
LPDKASVVLCCGRRRVLTHPNLVELQAELLNLLLRHGLLLQDKHYAKSHKSTNSSRLLRREPAMSEQQYCRYCCGLICSIAMKRDC